MGKEKMKNLIERTFEGAFFAYDCIRREPLFLEGSLSKYASTFINRGVVNSEEILAQYPEKIRKQVSDDLWLMRDSIETFFQKNVSGHISSRQTKIVNKNALKGLVKFAVKKWQVINCSLEVTSLCNNRCKICYLESFDEKGLSLAKHEQTANQLLRAGIVFVLLTGGEIFTRKDIVEIIKIYSSKGFLVEIKTNGQLIKPAQIRAIAGLNIYDIQVSVYEPCDCVSLITQRRYKASVVANNIRQMLSYGLPVSTCVMVGKHNVNRLQEYEEAIRSWGVSGTFYSPYITPCRSGSGCEKQYRLSFGEMNKKLFPFLDKINGFSPIRKYRQCKTGDLACYAGVEQISIDPTGQIFPCLDFRLRLGSIIDEYLTDILGRRKAVLERFSFDKLIKCQQCKLKLYCDSCVGAAILENSDFTVPSSHKCDVMRFFYTRSKLKKRKEV